MEQPGNIFEAIEKAGDKAQESKKVDLGPLSVLVEKQGMLESKLDKNHVSELNKIILDNNLSIETIAECLKMRNKELFKIRQQQIPEVMKEFGLTEVKALDGTSIKIVGDINVTKKDDAKLFKYLRDNKAGDLIKNQVIVTVEDEKERLEVITELDKTSCSYETKEGIHAGTLKKYVKELKKEGKQIPEDAVGVFDFEYSRIKK